jgi:hypothetical protein
MIAFETTHSNIVVCVCVASQLFIDRHRQSNMCIKVVCDGIKNYTPLQACVSIFQMQEPFRLTSLPPGDCTLEATMRGGAVLPEEGPPLSSANIVTISILPVAVAGAAQGAVQGGGASPEPATAKPLKVIAHALHAEGPAAKALDRRRAPRGTQGR